ncbi:MAG TPA: Crp/Fnr family transcriptional regulator, partial [Hyphomicrobiales bacterium]|nr:Crp/Fnr family transcriptional regulator [Hyphomicrobiales bacterium]
HPFITRLKGCLDLSYGDLECFWRLIEAELIVKKRRDLVVDGYEYRKLCFVEDGFAARYKLLHDGRRQIVNFVFPGDIVGLPGSFLEKAPYSVIALTDMKLQICSLSSYVELCCRHPQFGLALSWLAVYEAILCAEHIIDTGRRTPKERLAHLLLEIYSRLKMAGKASAFSFTLPFSQEVLSDALGLSVPHLNRTLAKLRVEELIRTDGRLVELLEVEALEKLGQFHAVKLTPVPVVYALPGVANAQANELRA